MNWYKKIKLSSWGHLPSAFSLDDMLKDPNKKDPRSLVTPADENTSGGMGTRFRGKKSPIDFSSNSRDEYSNQIENDIPTREHVMNEPPTEGIPPGELADPSDAISRNTRVMEQVSNPRKEPLGPHNMNRGKNIPGPTNPPEKENVFKYVLKNQKR